MYKEGILLLLLVILESSFHAHGECRLNVNYIQNSNGTLTYYDENGKIQIQRFPSFDEGHNLTLHCLNQRKISVMNLECDDGIVNPKDPEKCDAPIHAKVEETDADQTCPATMYRIGIVIENEFFELYRACYDKVKVQSHFSDAVIYWKPIHPKSPRPFFDADNLINQMQVASFGAGKVYATFKSIYGIKQNYIKLDINKRAELVIDRGHLTAAGDMTFYDQMYSTFKYLNVVPQFNSINNGNWLQIEHWVGNNIPHKNVLHVRTGALGILSLLNFKKRRTLKPAYLIPDKEQNPVPEWMYKIVRNMKDELLHVFLTYNNIFQKTKPTAHKCCKVMACPLKLEDSATLGFTYCCNPDAFVKCLATLK
ncbi:uncharacterized protein LOC133837103 [Drosophila sulfurigaster albostrigata]|uniref:uncharacterized protein LOC133837103 n=1 Tax=Drosophila sulfurigaster albostrigata TaxID=89887 RepID=UPI002D219D85|nr:uncharacterized protein LOC133837103 [Drosophila sulfurigaster albostrigata]